MKDERISNAGPSNKRTVRRYETPPPPPNWEDGDESTISPALLRKPHKAPSPIKTHVELNRETYTWDGKGWCDEYYVTPPKVIVQQLNDLLAAQLRADDSAITDKYELLNRARFARENGQYVRAIRLARRALQIEPGDCAAAAVLCATLRARGRSREALRETKMFVKAANPALLTSRAAAYCDLRMWEEAKKEIARSLAMEKSDMAFAVVQRIKAARPELYK